METLYSADYSDPAPTPQERVGDVLMSVREIARRAVDVGPMVEGHWVIDRMAKLHMQLLAVGMSRRLIAARVNVREIDRCVRRAPRIKSAWLIERMERLARELVEIQAEIDAQTRGGR